MRLIDADALMPNAELKGTNCIVTAYDIAGAPTIDAVQVIRCRDCKHYAGEGKRCDWDICVQVDRFYCYYGERKEL